MSKPSDDHDWRKALSKARNKKAKARKRKTKYGADYVKHEARRIAHAESKQTTCAKSFIDEDFDDPPQDYILQRPSTLW